MRDVRHADVSGEQRFTTSDLQLAAYLVATGYLAVRVEGPPDRRVFVFDAVPPEAIAAYHQDRMPVSPQGLFRAYRGLKRQLFEPA